MNNIQLKKACKARDLSFAGTRDELRERLGLGPAPPDVADIKYIQLRKTLKSLNLDTSGKPGECRKRLLAFYVARDEESLKSQDSAKAPPAPPARMDSDRPEEPETKVDVTPEQPQSDLESPTANNLSAENSVDSDDSMDVGQAIDGVKVEKIDLSDSMDSPVPATTSGPGGPGAGVKFDEPESEAEHDDHELAAALAMLPPELRDMELHDDDAVGHQAEPQPSTPAAEEAESPSPKPLPQPQPQPQPIKPLPDFEQLAASSSEDEDDAIIPHPARDKVARSDEVLESNSDDVHNESQQLTDSNFLQDSGVLADNNAVSEWMSPIPAPVVRRDGHEPAEVLSPARQATKSARDALSQLRSKDQHETEMDPNRGHTLQPQFQDAFIPTRQLARTPIKPRSIRGGGTPASKRAEPDVHSINLNESTPSPLGHGAISMSSLQTDNSTGESAILSPLEIARGKANRQTAPANNARPAQSSNTPKTMSRFSAIKGSDRRVRSASRYSVVPKQQWNLHEFAEPPHRPTLRSNFSFGASSLRSSFSRSPYRSPARELGRMRQSSAIKKMRLRMRAFQQSLEAKVNHLNESTVDFSLDESSRMPHYSSDNDSVDTFNASSVLSSSNPHRLRSRVGNESVSLLSDDLDEKFDEVDRVHSKILATLAPNPISQPHTATFKSPSRSYGMSRIAKVNQAKKLELLHTQASEQFQQEILRQKQRQMQIQMNIQNMVKENAKVPLQLDVPTPVIPAVMIPSARRGLSTPLPAANSPFGAHQSPMSLGASMMVREIEDLKAQQQNLRQLLAKIERHRAMTSSPDNASAAAASKFASMDLDGDGVVSQREFHEAVVAAAGEDEDLRDTSGLAARSFATLDANGDGVLSKTEFINAAAAPETDPKSHALTVALPANSSQDMRNSSRSPSPLGPRKSSSDDKVAHVAAAAAAASTSMLAESFGTVAKQLSALAAQQESQNQLMRSFLERSTSQTSPPNSSGHPHVINSENRATEPSQRSFAMRKFEATTPKNSRIRRLSSQRSFVSLVSEVDNVAVESISTLLGTISPTRTVIGSAARAQRRRARSLSGTGGELEDGTDEDSGDDDDTGAWRTRSDNDDMNVAAQEQMSRQNQLRARQVTLFGFLSRYGIVNVAKSVPGGDKAVGHIALLPHAWMRNLRMLEIYFHALQAGKVDRAQLKHEMINESSNLSANDQQAAIDRQQGIIDDLASSAGKLKFQAFLRIDSNEMQAETVFAVNASGRRLAGAASAGENWIGIKLTAVERLCCRLPDLKRFDLGTLSLHPLRRGAFLDKKMGNETKFRVKPRKIWLSDCLDTLHWSKDLSDTAEAKASKELSVIDVTQLDIEPQALVNHESNDNATSGNDGTTYHLCYQLKNREGSKKREVHLRIAQRDPERKLQEADYDQASEWLSLLQELVPSRLCKLAKLAVCDFHVSQGIESSQLTFTKGETLFEVVNHHGISYGFTAESMLEAAAGSNTDASGRPIMPALRSFRSLHVRAHPLCEPSVFYKKVASEKKFLYPRYVWCSDDLQILFWTMTKPAETRNRSKDRSYYKHVPLRTLASVIVESDKPVREGEDGPEIFSKFEATVTASLQHRTVSSAAGPDCLMLRVAAVTKNSRGAPADTDANAASIASREWLQHLCDYMHVMHPTQHWIFPEAHHQLMVLTVAKDWRLPVTKQDNSTELVSASKGDILLAILADQEWHGSLFLQDGDDVPVCVSVPQQQDHTNLVLRHPAYSGYSVCAKRGDESSFKSQRWLWLSNNMGFLLWAKSSSRIESIYDEDFMVDEEFDDDFGGGSPKNRQLSRKSSQSSIASPMGKASRVPKCIALSDVVSVVNSSDVPSSMGRDTEVTRLCFTVVFWLRGHSLASRPDNRRGSNTGLGASESVEFQMPSEEAKDSMVFLLKTLVNHRLAAGAAAEDQAAKSEALLDRKPSQGKIVTLAVDTTSTQSVPMTIRELDTKPEDATSSKAAAKVRDRLAASRRARSASLENRRGSMPEPWLFTKPLLVRRKPARDALFGETEWMRFDPTPGTFELQFWKVDSTSNAEDDAAGRPWSNSETEPTGLVLKLTQLESVDNYGEGSDDELDEDDEPSPHGMSLTLRNYQGRIDVDLVTGTAADRELWKSYLRAALAYAAKDVKRGLAILTAEGLLPGKSGLKKLGNTLPKLGQVLAVLYEGACVHKKFSTEVAFQHPRYFWVSKSKKFLCWSKSSSKPDNADVDASIVALAAAKKLKMIPVKDICEVYAKIAAKRTPEKEEDIEDIKSRSLTIVHESFQDPAASTKARSTPSSAANQQQKGTSIDLLFEDGDTREAWLQGLRVLGQISDDVLSQSLNDGDGEIAEMTEEQEEEMERFNQMQSKLNEGLSISIKAGTEQNYQKNRILWLSDDHQHLCWSTSPVSDGKPPVSGVNVLSLTQNPRPKEYHYIAVTQVVDMKAGAPEKLAAAIKADMSLLADLCLTISYTPAANSGEGPATNTSIDVVLETVVAHRLLFMVLSKLAKLSFEDNTPESAFAPDAWSRARRLRRRGQLVGSLGSAVNLLRRNFSSLFDGAVCSKKYATETKLQRRFVWLSPSKKFLCYCKNTSRPANSDSDGQIIALAKSKKLKFIPVGEIIKVASELPSKPAANMRQSARLLKDYCITITSKAADKKRIKAGKGETIELVVPTTQLCRAWVAGLRTLAGLGDSGEKSESSEEALLQVEAEATHATLSRAEEDEVAATSPSSSIGINHHASVSLAKRGAAEAARMEAQRHREHLGVVLASQLSSMQNGHCVEIKGGNEQAYKMPRALWLSEDRKYVCWTRGAAREKPKLEHGPVNAFSVTLVAPKPKAFEYFCVDDIVEFRSGVPPEKMSNALRQEMDSGSTMKDLCVSFFYEPGVSTGGKRGPRTTLDIKFSSKKDLKKWCAGIGHLSGTEDTGGVDDVVVEGDDDDEYASEQEQSEPSAVSANRAVIRKAKAGSKISKMLAMEAQLNSGNNTPTPNIRGKAQAASDDESDDDDTEEIKVAATPKVPAHHNKIATADEPPDGHYDCLVPGDQPLGMQLTGGEAAGPFGATPITIQSVEEDSVAGVQGCKAGDTLVAVNGTLSLGKAMAVVEDALHKDNGSVNRLRFRSANGEEANAI